MILARLFSKIYKKGGIVLVDHLGQKLTYVQAQLRLNNTLFDKTSVLFKLKKR